VHKTKGSDLSAGVGSEKLQTSGLSVAPRTRADPSIPAKRDKRAGCSPAGLAANRAVERYLHLEPGVFANSSRSGALDQSILASLHMASQ
jgi:hypothetical protein